MPAPALRSSPLHQAHLDLGAKMVEFGGWNMPLAYGDGTVAEHRACRSAAAVFDVSHLGTVELSGPGSFERVQRTLSNDLSRIAPGRAQYTHLLTLDGWVADDIIVWWLAADRFHVMPNASNTDRVRAALGGDDITASRAVVAVQGPESRRVLARVSPTAAGVDRFAVEHFEWHGVWCVAAGTGYTGEDGVECTVPLAVAEGFWAAVTGAGAVPAGLGARDTLRLEAGLPLHGHELGPGITPLQAGLGWVVGWDKGEFVGRAALERERREGPRRHLVGLRFDGRQPARQGARVMAGATAAGEVTSGNFSPMLERGIALALVDVAAGIGQGDRVAAAVRGRELAATVVPTRFWPPPGGSDAAGTRRDDEVG
ncbi:MAG: glycine cleavage system aminomethyltransferase GcvT [Acidimicrobiales bacterium]